MTMTLVQAITVGSGGASTIDFQNIPQTGTDLLILVSHRGTSNSQATIAFNGDNAGTTYSTRQLRGTDGSAASFAFSSQPFGQGTGIQQTNATTNTFGNSQVYVSNYTTSGAKAFTLDGVGEDNGSNATFRNLHAQLWNGPAAINRVTLSLDFVQNSTALLYTITKA